MQKLTSRDRGAECLFRRYEALQHHLTECNHSDVGVVIYLGVMGVITSGTIWYVLGQSMTLFVHARDTYHQASAVIMALAKTF